jgi:ketosteroid isomerase-like protein
VLRGTIVLAVIVAGLVQPVLAQNDVVRTIERLEDELNTAFNAYDSATMNRLWGDELVFISPNGSVATKAQRLAGLTTRPASIPVSTNDSITVNVYGDVAVAIVNSTWTGVPNATKPIRFRATHVWNQRAGAWKLVAAHVTQLAN